MDKIQLILENQIPVSFDTNKANNIHLLDKNRLIDEIIQIRDNVQKALPARPEIILVTSGHQDAGVSTVALNLAAIMSENPEEKILLIDGNLKHPILTQGFGLLHASGFCNLLEEQIPIEKTVRLTDTNNMYFMSVGKYNDPSMRVGRSFETDRVFKELLKMFSLIIIDCQPIEDSPDTIYLVGKAKNVVMVLESETSRRETIQNNKKRLEDMGASIVGAVLNRRCYHIPPLLYRLI